MMSKTEQCVAASLEFSAKETAALGREQLEQFGATTCERYREFCDYTSPGKKAWELVVHLSRPAEDEEGLRVTFGCDRTPCGKLEIPCQPARRLQRASEEGSVDPDTV